MRFDDFLSGLNGVYRLRNGFMSCCPAHPDRNPSLSIRWKDGRILIKCFAGCPPEDVVRAMGLTMGDLFDDDPSSLERARSKYPTRSARGGKSSSRSKGFGELIETYDYVAADDTKLHYVERRHVALPEGGYKKDFPQGVYVNGQKQWGFPKGFRPVLYRLPELLAAPLDQTVYIVEGEKDVHACEAQGLLATCNPGGAGSFCPDHAEVLRDRPIVIVMDTDEAGEKHARKVRELLRGVAASVRIVRAKEGKDAHDHFAAGHAVDELEEVTMTDPLVEERALGQNDREERANAVAVVLDLLESRGSEFWSDGEEPFATIEMNDRPWHVLVRSSAFENLVSRLYYESTKKPLNDAALSALTRTVSAKARYEGAVYDRARRIGWSNDEIFLALFDDEQNVVKISKDGWSLVHERDCPMRFIRGATSQPLPVPVSGGDLEELLGRVLNVEADHLPLVKAFLCGVFLPTGTFPVLVVSGQQGSGKSFGSSIIRNIVDPQVGGLQKLPRDDGSLVASLNASDILAYDNVSRISDDLSDSFCSIATGTGFSMRRLYTNFDLVTVVARRPIILNGIGDVVARPDLMDRSLVVSFRTLRDDERKGEKELLEEFRKLCPSMLGAVLDSVSRALRRHSQVDAPGIRLLDFARWAVGATSSESEEQRLRNALLGNRSNLQVAAIDNDVFAQAVIEWIEEVGSATMTVTEILAQLNSRRADAGRKGDGWPLKPESVSAKLGRLAPVLLGAGIEVEKLPRRGNKRPWQLTKLKEASQPSPASQVAAFEVDESSPGRDGVSDGSAAGQGRSSQLSLGQPLLMNLEAAARDANDGYDASLAISAARWDEAEGEVVIEL